MGRAGRVIVSCTTLLLLLPPAVLRAVVGPVLHPSDVVGFFTDPLVQHTPLHAQPTGHHTLSAYQRQAASRADSTCGS